MELRWLYLVVGLYLSFFPCALDLVPVPYM